MGSARPIKLSERLRRGRRAERARLRSAGATLEDLVVITGFSGAGKSTAMAVFEDAGYFCVDNLPPEMIRSLFELFQHEGSRVQSAAVVSDVRGGAYFDALRSVLDDLDSSPLNYRVVFLEADDQTLLRPLQGDPPPPPAGAHRQRGRGDRGRARAAGPDPRAGRVLRGHRWPDRRRPAPPAGRRAAARPRAPPASPSPSPPSDTSTARCATPTWPSTCASCPIPTTSWLCARSPGSTRRWSPTSTPMAPWRSSTPTCCRCSTTCCPSTCAEGKSHLVVGIGCTGGRHRSVAIAERLAAHYAAAGEHTVDVAHRDIDKVPRG